MCKRLAALEGKAGANGPVGPSVTIIQRVAWRNQALKARMRDARYCCEGCRKRAARARR